MHGLIAREWELLRLIATDRTDQEIAGELFIARTTAKRHAANIVQKLGVSSRTAAAWATLEGLAETRGPNPVISSHHAGPGASAV